MLESITTSGHHSQHYPQCVAPQWSPSARDKQKTEWREVNIVPTPEVALFPIVTCNAHYCCDACPSQQNTVQLNCSHEVVPYTSTCILRVLSVCPN
ncbi:hypothetical protein BaRGS_00017107 [Batillaria attramentaria]|uniref:Uncharacterized protein n=1 Tax=Batillaria attramentaria TaxID=370345 RepID=A0ABD0KWQ0_9CAEN